MGRPRSTGLASDKKVIRAYRKEYFKKHDRRKWDYPINYGITLERYNEILEEQGGVCAICKQPETRKGAKYLGVDHDHKCCPTSRKSCGKCVRGLLCHNCNRWLGTLESNWAVEAYKYLAKGA